jgi:hypothetical protein
MPERCENRDICCFIQREMEIMPVMAESILRRYCNGGKEKCARYMVKTMIMSGYTLPDDHSLDRVGMLLTDLHPSDTYSAKEMIGIMVK